MYFNVECASACLNLRSVDTHILTAQGIEPEGQTRKSRRCRRDFAFGSVCVPSIILRGGLGRRLSAAFSQRDAGYGCELSKSIVTDIVQSYLRANAHYTPTHIAFHVASARHSNTPGPIFDIMLSVLRSVVYYTSLYEN